MSSRTGGTQRSGKITFVPSEHKMVGMSVASFNVLEAGFERRARLRVANVGLESPSYGYPLTQLLLGGSLRI